MNVHQHVFNICIHRKQLGYIQAAKVLGQIKAMIVV